MSRWWIAGLSAPALSATGALATPVRTTSGFVEGTVEDGLSVYRGLPFAAGQYLEWTLPLQQADSRGNRRYFTIASAPTEETVRLGVKFAPDGSAFKRGLARLQAGDQIVASQLAGSFTLPRHRSRKLVFIAGGICITPFRSMLAELLDRRDARQIIILYGNNRSDDLRSDAADVDATWPASLRLDATRNSHKIGPK